MTDQPPTTSKGQKETAAAWNGEDFTARLGRLDAAGVPDASQPEYARLPWADLPRGLRTLLAPRKSAPKTAAATLQALVDHARRIKQERGFAYGPTLALTDPESGVTVRARFQDHRSAYASFGEPPSTSGDDPEVQKAASGPLVVRDVPLRSSCQMEQRDDGSWFIGGSTPNKVWTHRIGGFGLPNATPAMDNACRNVFFRAFGGPLAEALKRSPDTLAKADATKANNDLEQHATAVVNAADDVARGGDLHNTGHLKAPELLASLQAVAADYDAIAKARGGA